MLSQRVENSSSLFDPNPMFFGLQFLGSTGFYIVEAKGAMRARSVYSVIDAFISVRTSSKKAAEIARGAMSTGLIESHFGGNPSVVPDLTAISRSVLI